MLEMIHPVLYYGVKGKSNISTTQLSECFGPSENWIMEHEMRHGDARVSNGIRYAPLGMEYTFSGGYAKNPRLRA
jgi:hypothetical protein